MQAQAVLPGAHIFFDHSPDFLLLREFMYQQPQFEDIQAVLNKLSEKPDAVQYVCLSPLQFLACLVLLSCFHFHRTMNFKCALTSSEQDSNVQVTKASAQ